MAIRNALNLNLIILSRLSSALNLSFKVQIVLESQQFELLLVLNTHVRQLIIDLLSKLPREFHFAADQRCNLDDF